MGLRGLANWLLVTEGLVTLLKRQSCSSRQSPMSHMPLLLQQPLSLRATSGSPCCLAACFTKRLPAPRRSTTSAALSPGLSGKGPQQLHRSLLALLELLSWRRAARQRRCPPASVKRLRMGLVGTWQAQLQQQRARQTRLHN